KYRAWGVTQQPRELSRPRAVPRSTQGCATDVINYWAPYGINADGTKRRRYEYRDRMAFLLSKKSHHELNPDEAQVLEDMVQELEYMRLGRNIEALRIFRDYRRKQQRISKP